MGGIGRERARVQSAFRWFVVVQVVFLVYVVAEVAIALATHLRATENTSSAASVGLEALQLPSSSAALGRSSRL